MPAGCQINTAILSLYVTSSSTGRTLQAYRAASSWVEGTVNWNTQPAGTGSAANATVSGIGYLQWNVASLVQSMSTGANNGFLIRDAAEGANGTGHLQQLISRENGTNTPQLVITYTQAP
jgi:hypothetical protein